MEEKIDQGLSKRQPSEFSWSKIGLRHATVKEFRRENGQEDVKA